MLITNISKNKFSDEWDIVVINQFNDKQKLELTLDENFDILTIDNSTNLDHEDLKKEILLIQSHLLEISTFSKTSNK